MRSEIQPAIPYKEQSQVYIQYQIANREKILAISISNIDIDFLILAISISNIDIDFLNTTSHTVQRMKASIYTKPNCKHRKNTGYFYLK